jgi:transcriptional regulator with XRE-family HTH domain
MAKTKNISPAIKQTVTTANKGLSAPIIRLESRLGLTQEGMARAVGCTLSAYVKWRRGEREPSGRWLARMISLRPDNETLADFGIISSPRPEGKMESKEVEIRRKLAAVAEMLMEIQGEAERGNRLAREGLHKQIESLARGAAIASDATIPKARRARLLRDLLVQLTRADNT